MSLEKMQALAVFVIISLLNEVSRGEVTEDHSWGFVSPDPLEWDDLAGLTEDDIKFEVQNMHQDLTKSFIAKHVRRKRAIESYKFEVNLDADLKKVELEEATHWKMFPFNNSIYLFQKNGIYRVEGLEYYNPDGHLEPSHEAQPGFKKPNVRVVELNRWNLAETDRIMAIYSLGRQLFVLVSPEKGQYSVIYTLHGPYLQPHRRQRIYNQGYVTSAKFFEYYNSLYLIVLNNNFGNSISYTPIFKWVGTYMDEVHLINTRGAMSVDIYIMNSKAYIAIGQVDDSAMIPEVGSQVFVLERKGMLDKSHLLKTSQPVAIKFAPMMKEHMLIVGQAYEKSLLYWFDGHDFVYWQDLEGLAGSSMSIDTFTLPDGEPLYMTATKNELRFFTRDANSLMTSKVILNTTHLSSEKLIVDAQFGTFSSYQTFLAVQWIDVKYSKIEVVFFPLKLRKVEKAESQKSRTDSLTRCLDTLETELDGIEGSVSYLEQTIPKILTVDEDWEYSGAIVSNGWLSFNADKSFIDVAKVRPEAYNKYDVHFSPSTILDAFTKHDELFRGAVGRVVNRALFTNVEGNITAELNFNYLDVDVLDSQNANLNAGSMNGLSWATLTEGTLKKKFYMTQSMTGNIHVNNLVAKSGVLTTDSLSGIPLDAFLKTSHTGEAQTLTSRAIFVQNVDISKDFKTGLFAKINGIPMESFVFKNPGGIVEVHGTKVLPHLFAAPDVHIQTINGINLNDWFDSVLQINGPPQTSTGLKKFTEGLYVDKAYISLLNDVDLNDFFNVVMINGLNRTLEGKLSIGNAQVERLYCNTINGYSVKDFIALNDKNQMIKSSINVATLIVEKTLDTESINGIDFSDSVSKNDSDVTINTPVLINRATASKVYLDDNVFVNGRNLTELQFLPKSYFIYSKDGKPILLQNLNAERMDTPVINGMHLSNLKLDSPEHHIWKYNVNNTVKKLLLKNRKVKVKNSLYANTINAINLEEDLVRLDSDEYLHVPLNFEQPVMAERDVILKDGVTINDLDFSEIVESFIPEFYEGVISGRKMIKSLTAKRGIKVDTINNRSLEKDAILLKSHEPESITTPIRFLHVEVGNLHSDVDIELEETMNGEDLPFLNQTTAYTNQPVYIEGNLVFYNDIEVDSLVINELMNEKNFLSILKNAIFLDRPLESNISLTIKDGGVTFKDSCLIHQLNGIPVNSYLSSVANKEKETNIEGLKEFKKVYVMDDLHCGSLNGINMEELQRSVLYKSRKEAQHVEGVITIDKLVSKKNMNLEKIGSIPVESFVRIDEDFDVYSELQVTAPSVVFEGNVKIDNTINGHRMEEILEALKNPKHGRKFKKVEVYGNLSWKINHPEYQRLSYLFENLVTKEGDQVITAPVIFKSGFTAGNVTSDKWLNNINLAKINEDAVTLYEPLKLTGKNFFKQSLIVDKASLDTNFLNVISINNINLEKLFENIILDGKDAEAGNKTLKGIIRAKNIEVLGTVQGVPPKSLAVVDEPKLIPSLVLTGKAFVNSDIYCHGTMQCFPKLRELSKSPVGLMNSQTLNGIYNFKNIFVKRCIINSINDIRIKDLFLNVPHNLPPQKISGSKRFRDLHIYGRVATPNVNGYDMKSLQSEAYRKGEPEVIKRHVIFTHPVKVKKSMEILNKINDYDVDSLSRNFSSNLRNLVHSQKISESTKQQLTQEQAILGSVLSSNELLSLEYLYKEKDLAFLTSKERVDIIRTKGAELMVSLYGRLSGNVALKAGLPKGCFCDYVHVLRLNATMNIEIARSDVCKRDFILQGAHRYLVISSTISYNNHCSIGQMGKLVIRNIDSDNEPFLVGEITIGYVSDVKIFSVNYLDYLVIAEYYDPVRKSHDSFTTIYKLEYKLVQKIKSIPSHGAVKLAIGRLRDDWLIGIANSFPSKNMSIVSKVVIPSLKKEFTIGADKEATDICFVNVESKLFVALTQNSKLKSFKTNFIMPGQVLIYEMTKTLELTLYQTLQFAWKIQSVDTYTYDGRVYLIVSVPNKGIIFFEYAFVEGFVQKFLAHIDQAQDAAPLSLPGIPKFLVASTNTSMIVGGALDY